MPTVHVSLDTSVSPPVVTCNPKHLPVDHGKAPINWLPAKDQSFTFASLTGLPTSVFAAPTVTDGEITTSDNNQNNGPEIAYPYQVCVSYGRQTYCTPPLKSPTSGNGNPTVNNR
ncbi:MAG TPA: hypothetical protein VJ833_09095 [Rhodanobacteraceae bacterium]|nr:hypothetical protein [Rhodanobacteraceae bacterium]